MNTTTKPRKLSHYNRADRAEGVERLRTLYSILTGVPRPKLHLGSFVSGYDGRKRPTATDVKHACGSTACALGWAALYPEFQALGLYVGRDEEVHFKGEINLEAGCAFFALSESENVLFNTFSSSYWDTYGERLAKGLPRRHFVSEKRMALHRIRRHLELQGVITKKRSKELAKMEETM